MRHPSIYQRSLAILHKEHILKAYITRFDASRYLSSETTASEAVKEPSEIGNKPARYKKRHSYGKATVTRYDRDIKLIGTIIVKKILLRTFESILHKEGKLTPLQAYQVIRNCGTQLLYERPEKRVEVAHYMWDKIIETGTQPDVTLYNALLSVYIENDYMFNPLEVLEEMELKGVNPNRATLLLLMQGFAEKGDIAGTFKMLEFIKDSKLHITEEVYSALVTAYGRTGDIDSAKGVFDLMKENNLKPDLDSYTALLLIHAETGDVEGIMETLQTMQENDVYPNQRMFLVLLNTLSKHGHTAVIRELLETPHILEFVQKNLRDFLITVSTRGEVTTALLLLGYMRQPTNAFGQTPAESNERLLLRNTILSGQSMDTIMITIREMEKLGIFKTKELYDYALDTSYNARNPELGFVLIQEMLKKGITVRTHYFFPLLSLHASKRNTKAAQDVFSLMVEHGFKPDGKVLKYLLDSLTEFDVEEIRNITTLTADMPTTRSTITTIAQLFMMTGDFDKLRQTIELAKKEGVSEIAVKLGYEEYLLSKAFNPEQAVKILEVLDKYLNSVHRSILRRLQNVDPDAIKDNAKFVTLIIEAGLSHHLQSENYTRMLAQLVDFRLSHEFHEFLRVMKEHQVPLDFHQYRPMLQMMSIDGKAEAAQFCFDKIKEGTKLIALDYCRLIEAYGRCPISGWRTGSAGEKGIRRVKQLYSELSLEGMTMTKLAIGTVNIAYLRSGDMEQAEEIRFIHGEGYPTFAVNYEFLRAYAERGDVKKTLEYFAKLKEIPDTRGMPTFVYNQLIYCYGYHDDVDSQMKLLAEMDELGLKKNHRTFSPILNALCRKGDVKSALEIFGRAKEESFSLRKSSVLMLLNTMANLSQTEHFDSVLEDCLHYTTRASEDRGDVRETIKSLLFACLHAGKNDLALKLMLENDVNLNSFTLLKPAINAGWKGEVQAMLNAIEFLKENNVSPSEIYVHLVRAYDFHRDLDAIKAVYNKMVEEGIERNSYFSRMYNLILIKYSEKLSTSELREITSTAQDEIDLDDQSDSSSDEEEADTQEFERDSDTSIDEIKDPK